MDSVRIGKRAARLYNLQTVFFFCSLLMKPFYILPSGNFQIGDFFLMLSFLCVIVNNGFVLSFDRRDRFMRYFVICVALINLTYFIVYLDFSFLHSTLYYIFNLFSVITFRSVAENGSVLRAMIKVCRFNILLQLLIFFLGYGRWFGNERYMGTFNDPNQMGFFVMISYFIILVISIKCKIRFNPIDFIAALILIYNSASTGMTMGLFLLLVMQFMVMIRSSKTAVSKILFGFLTVAMLIVAYLFLTDSLVRVFPGLKDNFLFSRLQGKLDKGEDIMIDRQWIKLVVFPEKILYGAGEGMWERFYPLTARNEVHSTFLGILFCYGIIPTVFFVIWIFKQLKSVSYREWAIYLVLIVESITLVNQRQPLFWIFFALASLKFTNNGQKNIDLSGK